MARLVIEVDPRSALRKTASAATCQLEDIRWTTAYAEFADVVVVFQPDGSRRTLKLRADGRSPDVVVRLDGTRTLPVTSNPFQVPADIARTIDQLRALAKTHPEEPEPEPPPLEPGERRERRLLCPRCSAREVQLRVSSWFHRRDGDYVLADIDHEARVQEAFCPECGPLGDDDEEPVEVAVTVKPELDPPAFLHGLVQLCRAHGVRLCRGRDDGGVTVEPWPWPEGRAPEPSLHSITARPAGASAMQAATPVRVGARCEDDPGQPFTTPRG